MFKSFITITGLALGLAAAGCSTVERHGPDASKQDPASAPAGAEIVVVGYKDVSVEQAKRLVDGSPALVVLDVREPYEFADGRIPGARNLPLGQIAEWAPTLDASKSYLVVCRSGSRSARASQELGARGFKGVSNMTGGMLEWQQNAYPTQK